MNKNKRRNFGNIQKLPSGNFRARYKNPDNINEYINAPKTFTFKNDAMNWLSFQQVNIQRGAWVNPANEKINKIKNNILFNDYVIKHLNERIIKEVTRIGLIGQFNNHMKNYFKDFKVVNITRNDIIKWYNTLNKQQYRMCETSVVLLKLIFNNAVKDEIIDKNPANTVTFKKVHKIATKTDIQGSYIEKSDITTLIEKSPVKWRLMIILGAYFGLRISEALALTIKDIDLKKNILRINKSVHYMAGKKGCYIDKPKSIKSIRDISIPDKTIKYFTAHLKLLNTTDKNRYLFTRPSDNNPVRDVYYRDKVFNKLKKYTVKKEFRYHDLRHTCLTNYARAGATVKDLMQIAGHSKPDVAMIYQETTFTRLKELADMI